MTDDPNEAADETDEEREARRARIRTWLANLEPEVARVYADLKRMDLKGQQRR